MIVPVGGWLIVVLNRSVANSVSSLVISEMGVMWSADKFSHSTYLKLNFFSPSMKYFSLRVIGNRYC